MRKHPESLGNHDMVTTKKKGHSPKKMCRNSLVHHHYPLGICYITMENMAIEIVEFPIVYGESMVSISGDG